MPPEAKLGILAGGGNQPVRIIEACRRSNRPYFVVVLEGQGNPDTFHDDPHAVIRIGAGGETISQFRKHECDTLVMAGTIQRPSLSEVRPDWWGIKFFAKSGAAALGDDGILKALIGALETEGFTVIGADELIPEHLVPQGVLGKIAPTEGQQNDIRCAIDAARNLGRRDIGQAAVARGGKIIAEESTTGTDTMLQELAGSDNSGGVLAKMLKPGQERRADLPTIGRTTIENAHKAGLNGVVLDAGNAFFFEREETVKMADDLGLFVLGVDQNGDWQ